MRGEEFLIEDVKGILALDSRGNPTVKAIVRTKGGSLAYSIAPSGASVGTNEALELRDGGRRWGGKGVSRALASINNIIAPRLRGLDSRSQDFIDKLLIELDGTPNKSRLGGNAITPVSIAVAKAASAQSGIPLYKYLGGPSALTLPAPLMNIINGGLHAGNQLDVQEFIVSPVSGDSFTEALRIGVEVYKELRELLKEDFGPSAVNLGDEGGFTPPLKNTRQALDYIVRACDRAGYVVGDDVYLGLDVAATHLYEAGEGLYKIDGRKMDSGDLIEYYVGLAAEYPIKYLEDPFSEEDFESTRELTSKIGYKVLIAGDDLYATNPARIARGAEVKATNAAIIKVNQAGTLTEVYQYAKIAQLNGLRLVVSHRSGDSEDSFISDLGVALASLIKAGAPARGERTSKYNRLIEIEHELEPVGTYLGKKAFIM